MKGYLLTIKKERKKTSRLDSDSDFCPNSDLNLKYVSNVHKLKKCTFIDQLSTGTPNVYCVVLTINNVTQYWYVILFP